MRGDGEKNHNAFEGHILQLFYEIHTAVFLSLQ